jgi:hypothetical protein
MPGCTSRRRPPACPTKIPQVRVLDPPQVSHGQDGIPRHTPALLVSTERRKPRSGAGIPVLVVVVVWKGVHPVTRPLTSANRSRALSGSRRCHRIAPAHVLPSPPPSGTRRSAVSNSASAWSKLPTAARAIPRFSYPEASPGSRAIAWLNAASASPDRPSASSATPRHW